jgi:hypothetical protein
LSRAVKYDLIAVDTGGDNGSLGAAGTNGHADSEHNNGDGAAVPLDVESDEEPQQARYELQTVGVRISYLSRKVERTKHAIATPFFL